MDELIKRALEVRDALRRCVDTDGVQICRQCTYSEHGCHYALFLDAAKVIGRLIEEVSDGN